MAAAESNNDNRSSGETGKPIVSQSQIECYRFTRSDLLYYFLSVTFFLADIVTDSIIFTLYFLQEQRIWGWFAMSFTILPACIIQLFSLRWYQTDGSLKNIHWPLHFLFLGVLHRYLVLLCTAIRSLRSKRFTKDKNWVYRQESDICMLHLFESFMGAAPQLILQLYVMAVLHRAPLWTSVSAVISFCSLTWAVGTYTNAMHRINPEHDQTTWLALTLQALWRAGTLISRIAVLVLTALCVRKWFLLFLGLHWLLMSIWVILQKTDFCPTVWEERIYNCIIGLIYCFDFFNLRVGKSRYRVFIFYSIVVIQNLASLIVYALYFKDATKTEAVAIVSSVIIGGMLVGLTSMFFYYGKFHPSRVKGMRRNDVKGSNDPPIGNAASPRSFKQYYTGCSFTSSPRSIADNSVEARDASEELTTDKQFLLTSVGQISDSLEEGIVNQSCKIENESKPTGSGLSPKSEPFQESGSTPTSLPAPLPLTLPAPVPFVSDTELENDCNDNTEKQMIHRQKRRAICLSNSDGLDIDETVTVTIAVNDPNGSLPSSEKRRGICSSAQLILKMENGIEQEEISAEPLSQDQASVPIDTSEIDLESGKKFADGSRIKIRERLNTPTIFDGEKIEREKLSKELQQRDETMSCVTSIHDYENVCPLGVARPPWCIRSWKGYTDIETYIHDDSVVRDRRRDTLTSTTTGTTYSSEFSDTTCLSSILRGVLKQDDYLDTFTYDLVEPQACRVAYTDDSSLRSCNTEEQNPTFYIAKPVVIDDKGGMFALDTILEEHDESTTEQKLQLYTQRPSGDSVSKLVSTIDQIRKYTAENSPRHVYHTTGSHWEDLDPKSLIKKAQLTRALFKNELMEPAGTCTGNYINCWDSETESILRGKCEIETIRELVKYCTIESIKKTPLIDAILSDSPILGSKEKLQKRLTIAVPTKHDPSSNDNDLYVEMSPIVPVENTNTLENKLGNSSVSAEANTDARAINAENPDPGPDKSIRKKTIERYSRRKFSLLKERFEPKPQLVYVVTPSNGLKPTEQQQQSSIGCETDTETGKLASVPSKKFSDTSVSHDKENLAPALSPRLSQPNNSSTENSSPLTKENPANAVSDTNKPFSNAEFSLKDRRHIFLEQVLSPPKLLTWNKRKSLGPTTKKT